MGSSMGNDEVKSFLNGVNHSETRGSTSKGSRNPHTSGTVQ